MNDVLVREGFRVLQALTPKDALQIMMEAPISFVIADHFLRGVTGTELDAKLNEIKPTVPVLLHSGTHPDKQSKSLEHRGSVGLQAHDKAQERSKL